MALKLVPYTSPLGQRPFGRRMRQGVDECGGCEEACGVTRGAAASSTDLGGSSKYTSENLVGRSGERFHENSN